MTQLIEKPQRPADAECCEGDCSPCVWDIYFDQLQKWNEQEAKSRDKSNQKDDVDE